MGKPILSGPVWCVALGAVLIGACGDGPAQPSASLRVGAIWIAVTTTGSDPDPDGYLFQVDSGPAAAILPNQSVAWYGPEGDHTVVLSSVAPNCTVRQGNARTVRVTAGTRGDQGVAALFDVTCARTEKIGFTEVVEDFYYGPTLQVVVMHADGSNRIVAGSGEGPSWAPDGSRLVFRKTACYITCTGQGLHVVDPVFPHAGPTQLTSDRSDRDPDWSPDGRTIAFAREGALFRINRDGSDSTSLFSPLPSIAIAEPDWSPDGTRLVFSCEVEIGNRDICAVNADGTGFQRLTSDPERDSHPAWRPDGAAIVFTTSRYTPTINLAIMNPDGSGITRLLEGREAAWSPDGGRMVYVVHACPSGGTACAVAGLAIADSDGTGAFQVSYGTHREPAWRP